MTGRVAGLLDRHRQGGNLPKIFYTDTSAEYWRGDVGLSPTDLETGGDATAGGVRRYYLHPPSMDRALLNSTTPRSLEALAAILLMWRTIGRSIAPRCRICFRGSPWVNRRRTVHSRWLKMERVKHVVRLFPILPGSASWPVRPRMS